MKQGEVKTEGLNGPQLKFTIDAMAIVMDKLIQDSIELDETGQPLPAMEQQDLIVRQAMQILSYK